MNLIETEINRIRSVLANDPNHPKYEQLYAAQQALCWSTDPNGFKSPFTMIMGNQGEQGDCLGKNHLPPSLDTCAHCG